MAKALSLKLDDLTFATAELIRKRLKLPRDTYMRKAVRYYNLLHTRNWSRGNLASRPAASARPIVNTL